MFELFGNTIMDFFHATVAFIVVIALGMFIRRFLIKRLERMSKKTVSKIDDVAVIFLKCFGARFYALLALLVAVDFFITTSEMVSGIINNAFAILIGIEVIIVFFNVIDFFIKSSLKNMDSDHKSLATTLPAIGLLLKSVVAIFIAIFLLSNLGVNVTTLIAGFGIGGLAFAFAFQKILADLFSTFVIFFDKPFAVGESIEADTISGTVEHVGVKSTHIRSFTGEKIIVPNETLVSSNLKNITDRPNRKVVLHIPISYDISKTLLATIPEVIKDIVSGHKQAQFSSAKVRSFDQHAIMVEVIYWARHTTYDCHIEIRHEVHLSILEEFKKKKIKLGYPIDFKRQGK